MKKEEFPTFLNEQPTVIFGRTGRELLIIAIGLGMTYISYLRLGGIIHSEALGASIVKVLISLICVALASVVAFTKIAARPLEDWAFVWLFYVIVPKVYFYIPEEEGEPLSEQDSAKKSDALKLHTDDDDFADE